MNEPNVVSRFLRLGTDRRRVLARAAAWLTIASAAVALLPFRMAIRLGCVPVARKSRGSIEEAVWAIEAVSPRLPLRTMCIEKGIAVQRILRADGFDAILDYGARHDPQTRNLQAHVWVRVGDRTVM